jgi:hypothetical protein
MIGMRISTRSLMAVVSIIAADLHVFRYVWVAKSAFGFEAMGFDLGALPMVNAVAFAWLWLASDRQRRSPSLARFVAAGSAVLLIYFVGCWLAPHLIRKPFRLLWHAYLFDLKQHIDTRLDARTPGILFHCLALAVIHAIPQFLIATCGMWLCGRLLKATAWPGSRRRDLGESVSDRGLEDETRPHPPVLRKIAPTPS